MGIFQRLFGTAQHEGDASYVVIAPDIVESLATLDATLPLEKAVDVLLRQALAQHATEEVHDDAKQVNDERPFWLGRDESSGNASDDALRERVNQRRITEEQERRE